MENEYFAHLPFKEFFKEMSNDKKEAFQELCSTIESKIINSNDCIQDTFLIKLIENEINLKFGRLSLNNVKLLRGLVIGFFYCNFPKLLNKLVLPKSILDLIPSALDMLYRHLKSIEKIGYDIDDDFYLKDVCFVLGKSVPGGAQVFEIKSYISLWKTLRSYLLLANIVSVISNKKIIKPGHWLRIHTETRFLEDFNEVGWDRCYVRIADYLKIETQCNGMVGTSWFYDPALIDISPNLSYLQKRPLDNGAIRIRHRTSKIDIERAIMKSKTRKRLFEEKKYNPACFSIFWSRDNLIEWVKNNNTKNSLSQ